MPETSDDAQWLFGQWQEWAQAAAFRPVLIEAPCYSLRRRYAGTLDCLGFAYGSIVLTDWKTSGNFYFEHSVQNAAYRSALDEMGLSDGLKIGGLLIRLPKIQVDPAPFEELAIEPDTQSDMENLALFEHLNEAFPTWKAAEERGLAEWKLRKNRARVAE